MHGTLLNWHLPHCHDRSGNASNESPCSDGHVGHRSICVDPW